MPETKAKYRKHTARARNGLIPVQIWMPPELRTRLKVAAAETQWSMSALAMVYIHDGLKARSS